MVSQRNERGAGGDEEVVRLSAHSRTEDQPRSRAANQHDHWLCEVPAQCRRQGRTATGSYRSDGGEPQFFIVLRRSSDFFGFSSSLNFRAFRHARRR